jgi:hypothetical protein
MFYCLAMWQIFSAKFNNIPNIKPFRVYSVKAIIFHIARPILAALHLPIYNYNIIISLSF